MEDIGAGLLYNKDTESAMYMITLWEMLQLCTHDITDNVMTSRISIASSLPAQQNY